MTVRLRLALAAMLLGLTPVGLARASDTTIGHVGGEQVDAASVLRPHTETLVEMAETASVSEFRLACRSLIQPTLRRVVVDRALVQDAENALTTEQRAALAPWTEDIRTKLVERWGDGDAVAADRALLAKTGQGLESTLTGQCERAMLMRRLESLFGEDLVIRAADVRDAYARQRSRFERPAERSVSIIRTGDAAAADRIDAALAGGASFASVAASSDNVFRRAQSGAVPDPVVGDDGLIEPLGTAMRTLGPREHSGRLEVEGGYAWVFVESFTPHRHASFMATSEMLEKELRQRRYAALSGQHVERVMAELEHTEPSVMIDRAVEVAVEWYVHGGGEHIIHP